MVTTGVHVAILSHITTRQDAKRGAFRVVLETKNSKDGV